MEDRGITYNWPNIWRYLSVQVDSESPYQLLQDPDTQMFEWTHCIPNLLSTTVLRVLTNYIHLTPPGLVDTSKRNVKEQNGHKITGATYK